MNMNPSIQRLAQLMQARQEQGESPYVLLLGSSLSLTPTVRRAFAGTEDWEAFWREMRSISLTSRKALLREPLNALSLESGYQAVARLAEAGYFDLILTLNVDDALDSALKALKTLLASEYRVWVHGEVTSQEIVTELDHPTPRIQVVKLRGDINARKLPLTPEAQFEFPHDLEHAVTQRLSRDTIVVGDLPFDDDLRRCFWSRNGELWCILPDEPARDSFIERVKRVRQAGEIITGADAEFNAFFTALERLLPAPPRKPTLPPFLVPYIRNPDFVGREEDLERLHQALMGEGPVGIRPAGLTGMGGIGKTQLAVEYAYRYRDAYPDGVFWINATEPLNQGFAGLGKHLRPAVANRSQDEQIRAAFAYLQDHPDSLLVPDNLANPADLNQPLSMGLRPADLPCRVLFTTRRRDLGRFQAVEVAVLPVEPALQLLLRYPRRRAILAPTHPEHAEARAIGRALGWLPLALEIAGAFLGEWPQMRLADFRMRLQQEGCLTTLDEEAVELPSASLPAIHNAAVEATLRTQWASLTDDKAQLLLRVAGQLPEAASIPIPRLGLLAGVSAKSRLGRPSRLARALKRLENASLVEELREGQVRLHPLVHEFAAWLTPEDERESFRLQLETNVIKSLKDSAHRHERAITAGECLLVLGWPATQMRFAVLEALRELMRNEQMPEIERRTAASLLTRLHWLTDIQDVSPKEVLTYLDLFERFVDFPVQRLTVVKAINQMLKTSLCDRQQARLLAYRAAMLGRSGEFLEDANLLDAAAEDYEAARQIVSKLIESEASLLGDYKVAAQVNLGAGNITEIRAAKLTRPEDRERRQNLLHEAVNLYQAAAQSAQAYGQDVVLEATVYKELGWTYALLQEWTEAEKCCHRALEVLEYEQNVIFEATTYRELGWTYALLQEWTEAEKCYRRALEVLEGAKERAEDPAYIIHRAQVLETVSEVHREKGQSLASQQNSSQAFHEYETAYDLAQKEIEMLRKSLGESRTLVWAYIDSGDYLLAMSGCPGCFISQPVDKACQSWQIALDMAHRLGILDLEQKAGKRLERHCQNREIPQGE